MSKRGRMIYVPKPVLNRLDEIMMREKIKKRSKAWNKLAFLAGVGLNVEDNITLPTLSIGKQRKRKGKWEL